MVTFPAATDAAACIALQLQLFTDLVQKGITQRELGSSSATWCAPMLSRSTPPPSGCTRPSMSSYWDFRLITIQRTWRRWSGDAGSGNQALKDRLNPRDLLISIVGTASEIEAKVREAISDLASHEVVPFDRD